MATMRIALANIPHPVSREDSVDRACRAIDGAATAGAAIVCFPECYVPGYRGFGMSIAPPDAEWLERAWSTISDAARDANIGVVLGTERVVDGRTRISALVINPDGTRAGFQDKVQLDPSEDATYAGGEERRVFTIGAMTFGIAICHEGWRYPETVRAAARKGAQLVFHPHLHIREAGSYVPSEFLDPKNSFHEKAMLCRAAENTCFFASVNCASEGSGTTSAVIGPDGDVRAVQPYGLEGLLIADIDLSEATGVLAGRCRS